MLVSAPVCGWGGGGRARRTAQRALLFLFVQKKRKVLGRAHSISLSPQIVPTLFPEQLPNVASVRNQGRRGTQVGGQPSASASGGCICTEELFLQSSVTSGRSTLASPRKSEDRSVVFLWLWLVGRRRPPREQQSVAVAKKQSVHV